MTTTTSTPYEWVEQIDPSLLKHDATPLFGNAPPFPWKDLADSLSHTFEVDDLTIHSELTKWRTPATFSKDLGDHIQPLCFSIPEFEGDLTWLMAEEDIQSLMTALLSQQSTALALEIDKDFRETFYQFVAVETLNAVSQLDYPATLTPHLLDKKEVPKENALCVDIRISLKERSFWGRLLLSPLFLSNWRKQFTPKKLFSEESTQGLSTVLPLIIHLKAGKVILTKSEWNQIGEGDFLILDQCTINPKSFDGRVTLSLEGRFPLLTANIKNGRLQIIGPIQNEEVETHMEKQDPHENLENEFTNNDEDFEDFDDEDDFDFDEDDENEEEEEFDESIEEETKDSPEMILEETTKEKSQKSQTTEEFKEHVVSPESIPLTVIVEVGRVHMTMQKITELQPGNLVDLDIKPEEGVNLIINGKCVGKGELIKIGNTLGVRITDIAH
ncbi:MAG: hypothetical protein Tsb0021_12890 [Chlamydiales bacterium]